MRVFITGIGAVSSIGINVSENFESLKAMKSGVEKMRFIETIHSDEIPAAEIKLSDEQLIEILALEKSGFYTRTALIAMLAAKEAFENSGIKISSDFKTGLISSTTVAGMGKSEIFYDKYINTDFSNGFIKTHEASDSTEKIADFLNIKDYISTISTACSSSANAIMQGARMIKHGILDRAIVGGADSLSKFTINGFNTLMILDRNQCTPFDADRKGLNLGEGAAFLVLQSEESVLKNGSKILAEIKGYSNTNDAYHQTASSPDGYGPYLAMKFAMEMANLNPQDIDYVNVHGTGTPNNDLSEGLALKRFFGEKIPKFSSTKAYTGHTLAASGALEAVYSVLAIQNNVIFPNLFFKNAIPELNYSPETNFIENFQVNNVLSNSFGFGGNDSSLIFSKV